IQEFEFYDPTTQEIMSSASPIRKSSPRKSKPEDEDVTAKNEADSSTNAAEPSTLGTPAKRGPGRPRKASTSVSTPIPIRLPPPASPAVEDDGVPSEGRRSTRLRRGVYEPTDQTYDSASGLWRCLVPGCKWMSDSRAARSFHLRTDHPQYKNFGEFVPVAIPNNSEELAARRNARVVVSHTVKSNEGEPIEEHHIVEDDEELVEDIDIDSEGEEEIEEIIEPAYDGSDGEEEMIAMREENARMEIARNGVKRGRGRPRKGEFDPPGPRSRLRISDPEGIYPCYVEGCEWKGRYRSVRSAHMKHMHRGWIRPPSFTLARISRHGEMLSPNLEEPPKYECIVEGCAWRGNYKASRMAHIRNHHKDIAIPKKKSTSGGFVANGRYACHDPHCNWRGSSRSTRSNHMKREHRNFVNTVYSSRNVPCCDCGVSLQSHKNFVDHMVCEHNVGGIVQREFNDPRDYEEWFDAVQDSFSIDFIKKMGVKQTTQYQVLYLYCAKGGGYRDPRFHRYNRNAITPIRLQLRRRNQRGIIKCGKNCAAFLRVLNWADGRLTVIGCVEHTGHRMGTPLMRLSPGERDIMDEFLYSLDPATPLEVVLDRLRDQEAFQADGWECAEKRPEDFTQFVMDDDEICSLRSLLSSDSFRDSTFAVVLPTKGNEELSIGFMDEAQRELWKKNCGVVGFDEVRLCLGPWDVHIFIAIVFENQTQPRVAAMYMTTSSKRAPLVQHLKDVWPDTPVTVVTDTGPEWEDILQEVYHHTAYQIDHQLAEWYLLQEWAALCDQMVGNRVDRFTIICALRRWVRANDPNLFEGMMGDLFDALREMDLDELGQFIDTQLTDCNYHKKWTPVVRNPITEANNPLLELTCRTIREKFLANEHCKRIDEYVGFFLGRIGEFNQCTIGPVYPTGHVEPQRQPTDWMDEERDDQDVHQQLMVDEMDDLLPSSSHVFRDHKGEEDEMDQDEAHMVEIVEEDLDGGVFHEEIVVDAAEMDALDRPGPSRMIRMERMDGRQMGRLQRGPIHHGSGTSPRKQKLIEMIKKRMEEANEEDLELYENNINEMERMRALNSNERKRREEEMEEEIAMNVGEEEELIEEEVVG
ncbi:hypothetical protein PFISCL1PPCAC_10757, partial [Pristionchus fissidentatus]